VGAVSSLANIGNNDVMLARDRVGVLWLQPAPVSNPASKLLLLTWMVLSLITATVWFLRCKQPLRYLLAQMLSNGSWSSHRRCHSWNSWQRE
jgi:hypothetical protein